MMPLLVMKVYVIKIAVRGVSPMVWRRLRIAADTSLAALHFIIQIIQGWVMTTCTSFIFTVKITVSLTRGALVFRISRKPDLRGGNRAGNMMIKQLT
ncbi:IS1096 element passenger TnpR family protein [Escherichia coli]